MFATDWECYEFPDENTGCNENGCNYGEGENLCSSLTGYVSDVPDDSKQEVVMKNLHHKCKLSFFKDHRRSKKAY